MLLEVETSDKMIWVEEITVTQVRVAIIVGIEILVTGVSQEIIMAIEDHLAIEVRVMATLVETKEEEVEVEVDLIQVLMLGDRE